MVWLGTDLVDTVNAYDNEVQCIACFKSKIFTTGEDGQLTEWALED